MFVKVMYNKMIGSKLFDFINELSLLNDKHAKSRLQNTNSIIILKEWINPYWYVQLCHCRFYRYV